MFCRLQKKYIYKLYTLYTWAETTTIIQIICSSEYWYQRPGGTVGNATDSQQESPELNLTEFACVLVSVWVWVPSGFSQLPPTAKITGNVSELMTLNGP